MRIDSHQHFWNYDPDRHSWIDDSMASIRCDFAPGDLSPLLSSNHIDGTVVVQVDQTEAENRYLLELASQSQIIKGIVGWVDLRSSDLSERLDYFSHFDLLKGFRHIVQAEPEDDFMLQTDFVRGISKLQSYGYSYDILIFPNQLGAAAGLVAKFPDQRFVVDHIAKPYIKDSIVDGWREKIKELGKYQNVYCKVSGMVTEANWQSWQKDDFYPYLDVVVGAFGMERLMYGSDWPVCTLAASYSQVYELVAQYWEQFSVAEQNRFFGENSVEFYRL